MSETLPNHEPILEVPPNPPQPPPSRPSWPAWLLAALPWLALGLVVALVALQPPAYSSSALPLLSGMMPEPPIWGVLMRPWAGGADIASSLWWARSLLGVAVVALGVATVHDRSRGWVGALLALLLWLWPPARAALVVIGTEAWLALATISVVWAASALEARPRSAAAVGGLGLATMALAHPLGLCASPLFVVVLAMRPQGDDHRWPAQATAARPIWLAWLAAVLVAVAIVRVALPDATFLEWWKGMIDAIRAPLPPVAYAPDCWPLLGPLSGLAARTPPLLLLLALFAAFDGRHRRDASAPLAWALMAWLTVVAVAGRPLPRALDPLVVVAPLLVALATLAIRNLLAALRPASRCPGLLLASALVAGIAAEGTSLVAGDARTSLGQLASMVEDVDLDLPVVLDASALGLLEALPGDVDIWPGRREGNSLASALIRLELLQGTVRTCPASSCGRVLLRTPASGRIDRAWSSLTEPEAAAGLWSLRSRPTVAAPAALVGAAPEAAGAAGDAARDQSAGDKPAGDKPAGGAGADAPAEPVPQQAPPDLGLYPVAP